jgi:hypothetical protein
MRRRQFITLLGGAAAGWPLAASAQQPGGMRRIGVLMASAADEPVSQARIAAFLQGLSQLGWTDDRNVRIDTRWAVVPSAVEQYEHIGVRLVVADAIDERTLCVSAGKRLQIDRSVIFHLDGLGHHRAAYDGRRKREAKRSHTFNRPPRYIFVGSGTPFIQRF